MRSVPAWEGKTDDEVAPPRVRMRVFRRENYKCHKCTRAIGMSDKWTLEHVIAICNGGGNREDNLACTCSWCLPIKNAEDAAIKKKLARIERKHRGDKKKSRWPSRPMSGGRSNVKDINEL